MIYANQERAAQAARELNERRGHPRAKAIHTPDGWTVRVSYDYGVSGPEAPRPSDSYDGTEDYNERCRRDAIALGYNDGF